MTAQNTQITVDIMGREFIIKSPADRLDDLNQAIELLKKQLDNVYNVQQGFTKSLLFAAINLAMQVSELQSPQKNLLEEINIRIAKIGAQVDKALPPS